MVSSIRRSTVVEKWSPTPRQLTQWDTDGYFIARDVVSTETATELRGVIKNVLLEPEPSGHPDSDPMDPMGDTPDARAARFRKLGNFCVGAPLIWHTVHCGEPILAMARHYLGDDLVLKYNSVFVKPARTGSATP